MSWSQVKNYDIPFYTPISHRGRTHKLCRLPNGILTLLISDPSEKSSACSLSVATGSHNDPEELPGLAHLCEHMILAAGSKVFPNPGLYHELIAKRNGSQNAYTTGEQTTFYFELPNASHAEETSFNIILEIFSSFFKSPLFNQLLINKEIYAIESEHEGNICNLTKIFYHAARLMANEEHPFSRFSTGNINTLSSAPQLKKINVKNKLHEYFKEHFHASNMTLCIRGAQSVNVLTKLALTNFSDIRQHTPIKRIVLGSLRRNRPITPSRLSVSSISPVSLNFIEPISNGGSPIVKTAQVLGDSWSERYKGKPCFDRYQRQNAIIIKSTKQPVIRLLFPVVTNDFRFSKQQIENFGNIWCEVFGDESEGSICYFLKNKIFITDCYAFVSKFALNNIGLVLELKLTDSGMRNIENIINSIFKSAISSLIERYTEELAQFLSEINTIDLIRFLHKETEPSPMEECSGLSDLLQDDLEVLSVSCLFKRSPIILGDNFKNIKNYHENEESKIWWLSLAKNFQKFLKRAMTVDNVRILLLTDFEESKYFGYSYNQNDIVTDPYYEFSYLKTSFVFNKSKFASEIDLFDNVSYPEKNDYIPLIGNSLSSLMKLLNKASGESGSSMLALNTGYDHNKTVPQMVSNNNNYEMWVLKEHSNHSLESKTIVSFELLSLKVTPSPENTMNLEILGQILNITLTNQLYPSLRLGYTYEIASSTKGDVRLCFTISGFSYGLEKIVKTIIKTCMSIATDKIFPSNQLLRRARVITRKKYENAASGHCVKLASVGLMIMLEKYMWSLEDRLDALENSDRESFKKFCCNFFSQDKYSILFVQGNLSCADEINLCLSDNLTNHLQVGLGQSSNQQISGTTKHLNFGTNTYFEYNGHKDDPNNSIVYFIQTGLRNNASLFSLTAITGYLLSLTLVPELRNKKQIGYVVFGGLRILSDTIGIHISVMSGNEPLDLEEKIDEYLLYLECEVLGKLSDSQFYDIYLKSYLLSMNGDRFRDGSSAASPANLMDEIIANVQAGDSSVLNSNNIKLHKKLRNDMSNKRYKFLDPGEEVDTEFIRKLTLKRYLDFFREYISINSKHRRKLSIMITTPMTTQDIMNRKIYIQLEAFLKIKGFPIKSEDLREIIEKSQGRPGMLIKELFNWFKIRNKGWKLCLVVLKEIVKMISTTIKQKYSFPSLSSGNDNSTSRAHSQSAIPLQRLENINVYRL